MNTKFERKKRICKILAHYSNCPMYLLQSGDCFLIEDKEQKDYLLTQSWKIVYSFEEKLTREQRIDFFIFECERRGQLQCEKLYVIEYEENYFQIATERGIKYPLKNNGKIVYSYEYK